MTFDAGSIDSRITLDRSQFSRELRAARDEGERFGREAFTVRLKVDRTAFRSELDKAREDVRKFGSQSPKVKIGVDSASAHKDLDKLAAKLKKLTDRPHVIHIRTDVNSAELNRVEQQLRRINLLQNQPTPGPSTTPSGGGSSSSSDGAKSGFELMQLALGLAPAVIPLAGAVGALGGSFAVMGAAGILAFKGIQAEMKAGTALGKQYQAGITTLTADLHNTEHLAAGGLLSGFQSGVTTLNRSMPTFNLLVGTASHQLGDLASHALHGVVGGLGNFSDLIQQGGGYLDSLAAKFDAWANGPGGQKFASALSDDLAHVVPLLAQIGSLLVKIVAAGNPIGTVLVDAFTAMAAALNSLPLPAISALIALFTASRLAGALGGLKTLGGASRLAPYLRGGLAVGAAAAATQFLPSLLPQSYRNAYAGQNPNSFGAAAYAGANAVKNAVTGNFTQVAHDRAVANYNNAAINTAQGQDRSSLQGQLNAQSQQVSKFNQLLTTRNALEDKYGQLQSSNLQHGRSQFAGTSGIKKQLDAANVALDAFTKKYGSGVLTSSVKTGSAGSTDQLRADLRSLAAGYHSVVDANSLFRRNLLSSNQAVVAHATSIDQVQAAYSQYDKTLNADRASQDKWVAAGKGLTVTLDGNKYSLQAYQAALAQANGDGAKAVGILEGHRKAVEADKQALADSAEQQARLADDYGKVAGQLGITTSQLDLYRQIAGVTYHDLASGQTSAQGFAQAVSGIARSVMAANVSTNEWLVAVAAFNQSAHTAADRAALIGATLKASNGDMIGFANTMVNAASANQQLVTDLGNLNAGVINLKTGAIDYHNAGAAPLLNDLQNLQTAAMNAASATYQHELKTRGATRASDDAVRVYESGTRGALIDEATKLLGSSDAAQKLADKYFPLANAPDLKKQIEMIGSDHANAVLAGILEDLDRLSGLSHTDLYITTHYTSTGTPPQNLGSSGNSGSSRANSSAAGNIFEYYAGGGESHVPQIARAQANTVRVWAEPETQGEAYIPFANDWRRPRAKAIATETVRRLGGVAKFAGGGTHNPYHGVDYGGSGSGSGSKGKGSSGSKSSGSKKSGSSSTGPTAAQTARINRLNSLTSNLAGALTSLTGMVLPVDALTQALGGLANAMQQVERAGVGNQRLVNTLKRDETQLKANIKLRDQYQGSLDNAKSKLSQDRQAKAAYSGTVRDGFLGQFDASSGNGYAYGIKASLKTAVANTQKFAALRKRAVAMHLDPRLIQMYEQAGPSGAANLEAIVGQGQKYVDGINKDYSALYGAASSLGQTAAEGKYDKQIAQDQSAVATYTKKVHDENVKIRTEIGDIRRVVGVMQQDLRNATNAAKKK